MGIENSNIVNFQKEGAIIENEGIISSNEEDNNLKYNGLKKNTVGVIECIALSVGGIGLSASTFFVFPNIAASAGTSVPLQLLLEYLKNMLYQMSL
ncbi:hypothetical protein ACTFIR_001064 [Dictyostelium discoideum]